MSTQKNEQPTQHEIADANRHTGESCGEVSGGFICTRTPGHTGLHVASNGTEGVKSWPITPPTDTTGSGREGEMVVKPDVIPYLQSQCNRYMLGLCSTLSCMKRGGFVAGVTQDPDYSRATCEYHEAVCALTQVEALRRAAKEFEKQVARRLWTSDDGVNIRDSDPGDYIDDDPALATAWSLFRAAIDSAQRQEGR